MAPPLDLADSLSQLSIALPAAASPACTVLYHASCLHHRFCRPSLPGQEREVEAHDASIVERPERLRAVLAGVHAAIARNAPLRLEVTSASLSLASAAVHAVHGPLHVTDEGDYASDLQQWLQDVGKRHAAGESEIPPGFAQGDLYLAPEPQGSRVALEGALGAACQAVDQVCEAQEGGVVFAAVRPPGHHCGRDSPSGFCFVNTVAVALQHAHEMHDVDRVCIFDIDLHHGNGSQSLVWDINAAAAAQPSQYPSPAKSPKGKKVQRKRPLKVFYGSLHDILSYPPELGDPQAVATASMRLAAHGQHICNVHLRPYASDKQFHQDVYPTYRDDLFGAAKEFCKATAADGSKTLVMISAGMDACELEYSSMSRHSRRVPISFYDRFARDVMAFSRDPATFSSSSSTRPAPIPRVVSILEGGYSDAALMSGTCSLLHGLTASPSSIWQADALDLKDVQYLDKACCSNPPPPATWKKLPAWSIQAGESLAAFLGESREEWAKAKERQLEVEARAAKLSASTGGRTLRDRKVQRNYKEEESTVDLEVRPAQRSKSPAPRAAEVSAQPPPPSSLGPAIQPISAQTDSSLAAAASTGSPRPEQQLDIANPSLIKTEADQAFTQSLAGKSFTQAEKDVFKPTFPQVKREVGHGAEADAQGADAVSSQSTQQEEQHQPPNQIRFTFKGAPVGGYGHGSGRGLDS